MCAAQWANGLLDSVFDLAAKVCTFFIAHANQAVSHENGFIATTLELSIDVESVLVLYKQINIFFLLFLFSVN